MEELYRVEHLNHLGIVAEVCREIGVAEWLNQHDPENRQQVSVGTATVAMVLNGLGFSNRQLYLLPQFFADKPIEHLLGTGIKAEDLNDDCLGRTLDWLYEQDVTQLFAGIALRARKAFGITAGRLHADTTSFSVQGAYEAQEEDAEQVIAITYGYSRDHREDLKQWMLSIITSGEGVPLFLRPLNGNASDKQALAEAVKSLTRQLKKANEAPGVYIADSGVYSTENMTGFNAENTHVDWVSRVPETMSAAKAMVMETPEVWQSNELGTRQWWSRVVLLPQGPERWIVVRTKEGIERARKTVQRRVEREQEVWNKRIWHVSHQDFACEQDAQNAYEQTIKKCPSWFAPASTCTSHATYEQRGRPRKDPSPVMVWQMHATLTVIPAAVEAEVLRDAAFIVGTNLLDATVWSDAAILALYREQSVVEKGFAFLKDPLFLASSVFVKKPERIMAIAFLMVVCLLVYKLAEVRIRQRLATTGQTVPNQLKRPTARPTMRWLFHCFEGIDLLAVRSPTGEWLPSILRLSDLHRLVLHLLGPAYEYSYLCSS